jgi:hypothetical protein
MSEQERIARALEDIHKGFADLSKNVVEIKGDVKLQATVLGLHVTSAKEFKSEIDLILKNQAMRIEKLEKWQIRVAAIASAIAAIASFVFAFIKEQFTP